MAHRPLVIGIAGGTASGKTTLANRIKQELADMKITYLEMDCFYRGLTPEEHEDAHNYNFDHPTALDMDGIFEALYLLVSGQPVNIPTYDFTTHTRTSATTKLRPSNVIIIEGIHCLVEERIRNLMSFKIFVQTDDDIRLGRRIQRDIRDRGRDLAGILEQYFKFVKPAYDEFVRPSMKYADIIVPNGAHNQVGLSLYTSLYLIVHLHQSAQCCVMDVMYYVDMMILKVSVDLQLYLLKFKTAFEELQTSF